MGRATEYYIKPRSPTATFHPKIIGISGVQRNACQAQHPAHRFKAVGDVKVGSPLKDVLLWVPLSGCHWVLHTSTHALVISPSL